MKLKRNDQAYDILWDELNALEVLKQNLDNQIDCVVKLLKRFEIPKDERHV